jgi:ferredoxin
MLFRKILKKKYKYIKPYNLIKYTIVSLIILSLFLGSSFFINLFDPYSVYVRIMTNLVKPLILTIGNMFVMILNKLKIYASSNFNFHNPEILSVIISSVFLLTIFVLSILKGRLYCNTICPVGTILGIISRFSFFRIMIKKEACIACGICENKCKAECINGKEKVVDFSRCITCYNCLDVCPHNAIGYRFAYNLRSQDLNYNRRNFLKNSGSIITGLFFLVGFPIKSVAKSFLFKDISNNPRLVAPPGAVSFTNLTNLCTGCHLCINECPTKVIKPSFLEYGLAGTMQPRMDFSKSFCDYECNKCTLICPTGALKPLQLEKKKLTQIGKVNLDFNKCIVFSQRTDCGACAEHCPTGAVYMVEYEKSLRKPVTADNQCIGCGACEHICPALPVKAIVVDGNIKHSIADKPKVLNNKNIYDKIKSGDDNNELKEFPF